MENKKRIVLIDGNSLMFRAFYATSYTGNLMKTRSGLYTNALFGFCNMLTKIIENGAPYIFIAFDAGKKTFRHQQYEGYKGTRKALPEELRVQIPLIKKYLDILGITRYETFDYEADDLVATVSKLEYDDFDDIRVISGDKDLLQLVNEKVTVCLTRKGVGELEEFTIQNFKEKMGFEPLQIIDYKGLVGDTSDNLPGIKGVGEKTAVKLINQYGSLENIYDNLEQLTPKMQELFLKEKETAFKCKELATLYKDVPLEYTQTSFALKEPNYQELISFFKEMEFNSLLKKVINKTNQTQDNQTNLNVDSKKVVIIKDDEKIDLNSNSIIISEVFGSNYYTCNLLGLGMYINNNEYFFTEKAIQINESLKQYLEDNKYTKTTFDCKQIYFVLKKYNIDIVNIDFDFMLSSYLINPSYSSDDFKKLADEFVNNNIEYYDNIYGTGAKMAVPDIIVYSKYCLDKCILLKEIKPIVLNKIKEYSLEFLDKEELELAKTLFNIEYNGLKVDLDRLKAIGEDLKEKAEEIQNDIYFIAGHEFNVNSFKQLGEVLFEELKLPHGKKNKSGFSTSVDVLEKLSEKYVIAKDVLDYRAYTKLINTYVNGINDIARDGFIHPLYKQALTLTGRLSSVEPNIQNMPIRTEVGQVIREIFTSRFEDGLILSVDYSQIELRVLADLSSDEVMIKAFKQEVDFHTLTASTLFEVNLDSVTKEMRRTAKAINFGIIYGMSAWGLSETINISPIEANLYINKYFYTYSKAKDCLDKFISDAKEKGYTLTKFNRRRYIPEINDTNGNMRAFGERTAMNSPVQGTAADIIKIAMNRVRKAMEESNVKTKMIAQVHDELVFDVPKDEIDFMKELVKEQMEKAVELKVPLIAQANVGKTWFEAK